MSDESHSCTHCSNKAKYMCGTCKSFFYCNKKCQENDWNNGHHYVCEENKSGIGMRLTDLSNLRRSRTFEVIIPNPHVEYNGLGPDKLVNIIPIAIKDKQDRLEPRNWEYYSGKNILSFIQDENDKKLNFYVIMVQTDYDVVKNGLESNNPLNVRKLKIAMIKLFENVLSDLRSAKDDLDGNLIKTNISPNFTLENKDFVELLAIGEKAMTTEMKNQGTVKLIYGKHQNSAIESVTQLKEVDRWIKHGNIFDEEKDGSGVYNEMIIDWYMDGTQTYNPYNPQQTTGVIFPGSSIVTVLFGSGRMIKVSKINKNEKNRSTVINAYKLENNEVLILRGTQEYTYEIVKKEKKTDPTIILTFKKIK